MRIIEPGDLKPTELRFSCETCGCVFDADASEYSFSGCIANWKFYRCRCPSCDKLCTLDIETEGGESE